MLRFGLGALGLAVLAACAPPGYESAAFTAVRWPAADQPLSIEQRVEVEGRLRTLNYLREPADGVITAGSRTAIRTFQRDIGAPSNGFVSLPLLDALQTNTAFLSADELRAANRGVVVDATRNRPARQAPLRRAASTPTATGGGGGDAGGSGGGGGGAGGSGAGAWN
ncbi:peptidoglycan-binding protein [Litorisediminicola beolgyonensis]|uniref:Peptidoglycan-binding protein n=1 Tax=Litorisediminicola beolgyonensis TaxID=1173614 RepID=A0ABW3ZLQ0_9RHOB